MKVYVVVVTFNAMKWIRKCLESVALSNLECKMIVVDNGSSDGTQKFITDNFNQVQLIQSEKNMGFGAANNIGITKAIQADADYVFLLNQDAWIEENTIKELVNTAQQNPEFGIISPVHLNGTSSALDLKFSEYIIPERCPLFISDMYLNKLNGIYEIEFVNAAAWLISSACIKKTGLFEPIFFLYGEDNNYLQRVAYHNFRVGVSPACTICHDREIREEGLNKTGSKIWVHTQSLIMLLDIRKSYFKSILFFFRQNLYFFFKSIKDKRGGGISSLFSELFFLFSNYFTLKRARNKMKAEPEFYLNATSSKSLEARS
jgi:GT2 family glycosyltransferase